LNNAADIIVELMQSDELQQCINKAHPRLREDLKGELSLILLEIDPEKIVMLFRRHQLKFFVVRIILNSLTRYSPLYKKYRNIYNELNDNMCTNDDDYYSILHRKQLEETAVSEIENLEWYEREMVKLYLETGNYRDMQKKTHIPYVSCFNTVKDAVSKIKTKVL